MEQPQKSVQPKGFLNHMSIYGLEFAVAMVTLLISISILSFGVYALFNYIVGADSGFGYVALWTSASAIVWVPVTFIFYARARSYELRNPSVSEGSVQRTFVIIYQVAMILTIISFAVTAVYSALIALANPSTTADSLVRVTAPSAISALLYYGALVAFFKKPLVSRNVYLSGLIVLSLLVFIPVIILSIMSLRGSVSDDQKERDLTSLQSSVTKYTADNIRLPNSLSDIDTASLNGNVSDYSYKKDSANRYQLCANFSSKATSTYDSTYEGNYTSYPSFTSHSKGEQCFKIQSTTLGIDGNKKSFYDNYSY